MGIPSIMSCAPVKVSQLIGFNQAISLKCNQSGIGVHFYLDDYQFERVWNFPNRYVNILKHFGCVAAPDFSMLIGMPKAMMIWNHYRKMAVAQFWQNQGIQVIPTLNWADRDSWDFCFDGMPVGGSVSVSTLGVMKNPVAKKIWYDGMTEAVRRLKPEQILAYGQPIEFDPAGAEVVWFRSEHLDRMRKIRKKENGPRTNFLVQNPRLVYYVASMMGSQEGPDGGRTASQNSTNRRVFFTTSAVCPSWKSGLHLQEALLTPDSLGTAPMSFPSAMSFFIPSEPS